jgi:hypothetical protein
MPACQAVAIPELHNEYRLWMTELTFYREEIKLFELRLQKIFVQSQAAGKAAAAEHFQNKFILQKEVIDILKHNLRKAEKQLTSFVHSVSGMGLSSIKMDNHPELREEVQTFKKIYTELKKDFRIYECNIDLPLRYTAF